MSRRAAHSLVVAGAGCALAVTMAVGWSGARLEPPGDATLARRIPGDDAAADAARSDHHGVAADAGATRSALASGSASPAQPDPDWLRCPRWTRDLAHQLVRFPEQADAAALLRSRTFNPRDVWLSPDWRERLGEVVAATADSAAASAQALAIATEQEFALARERGATIAVDLRVSGDLPLRDAGPDPFFQQSAGSLWAAPRSVMPRSCGLQQHHRALGKELVTQIGRLFQAAGALSPSELELMRARTDRVAGVP